MSRTQLLLSVVKPFQPVSKSTVAHWMKILIQESGVGKHFTAHSIRGAASTAAALKGMTISESYALLIGLQTMYLRSFISSLLTLGHSLYLVQLRQSKINCINYCIASQCYCYSFIRYDHKLVTMQIS